MKTHRVWVEIEQYDSQSKQGYRLADACCSRDMTLVECESMLEQLQKKILELEGPNTGAAKPEPRAAGPESLLTDRFRAVAGKILD